jgi:hypothetical protein
VKFDDSSDSTKNRKVRRANFSGNWKLAPHGLYKFLARRHTYAGFFPTPQFFTTTGRANSNEEADYAKQADEATFPLGDLRGRSRGGIERSRRASEQDDVSG